MATPPVFICSLLLLPLLLLPLLPQTAAATYYYYSSGSGFNPGQFFGVLGSLVCLVGGSIGLCVYCCCVRRRRRKAKKQLQADIQVPVTVGPPVVTTVSAQVDGSLPDSKQQETTVPSNGCYPLPPPNVNFGYHGV